MSQLRVYPDFIVVVQLKAILIAPFSLANRTPTLARLFCIIVDPHDPKICRCLRKLYEKTVSVQRIHNFEEMDSQDLWHHQLKPLNREASRQLLQSALSPHAIRMIRY